MPENTRIADYLLYLAYLNNKLAGFFEKQSPYIFCKKGCAKCCQSGEYPFSNVEFGFIMIGFSKLSKETQSLIMERVKNLKEQKAKTEGSFEYECPFLINNECSVYDFRGIICRSFGLMSINPVGKTKIPFCAYEGLNYSNVLNLETAVISSEKYKQLGDVEEPVAFNVGYEFLTSNEIGEKFNINFGEKRALIDWF